MHHVIPTTQITRSDPPQSALVVSNVNDALLDFRHDGGVYVRGRPVDKDAFIVWLTIATATVALQEPKAAK